MKILIITSEIGANAGGLSFACYKFEHLLTNDLKYHVYYESSVDDKNQIAEGGYRPELFHHISNEYRIKYIISKYKNERIDYVVAFGGSFNGYFSSICAQSLNCRLLILLRGTDINLAKWDILEIDMMNRYVNRVDNIICLSEEMRKNFLMLFPHCKDKTCIIPNIIDNIAGDVNFPNFPQKIIIGTAAAHINEKKGIANLLCMIKQYTEICEMPIRFDIVGDVDEDLMNRYKTLINDFNINNSVRFVGYLSREDYHKYIQEWDFYIQGSVCEGFGNSVAEAIECGKGIILSPTGFIAEMLIDHYPLLIFKNLNPQKMAEQLLAIFNTDIKELSSQYKNAYYHISNITSHSSVVQKWKALFDLKKGVISYRTHGILCMFLHDIAGEYHDHITTPIHVFKEFVEKIYKAGYDLCSMQSYMEKTAEQRKRCVVLTFDDGYSSSVEIALPILKKYGFSATIFINTNFIGKSNSWNCKDTVLRRHIDITGIKKLYESGWEIGSHGHTHRNILKLTAKEIMYEFAESKHILESIVGCVRSYAFPYGDSSQYTREICGRYYDYIFSMTDGGTELAVDKQRIRRYTMDNIYNILEL